MGYLGDTRRSQAILNGNPACVWIGNALPVPAEMLWIAAKAGSSETAFIAPAKVPDRTVRYLSPAAEADFCGHATIAAGVNLGEAHGTGTYRFATKPGEVPVSVHKCGDLWLALGGVCEDPATGAAAAAFACYLRNAGLLVAPTRIIIRQGEAMGRPSTLCVEIPVAGWITVLCTASRIAA